MGRRDRDKTPTRDAGGVGRLRVRRKSAGGAAAGGPGAARVCLSAPLAVMGARVCAVIGAGRGQVKCRCCGGHVGYLWGDGFLYPKARRRGAAGRERSRARVVEQGWLKKGGRARPVAQS